jgi:atrophin-1 interacting protein 3 (BAI1-associated protein 1)
VRTNKSFFSAELQNFNRTEIGYPYNVTVTRRENEGFGFVIISAINKAGSTIGKLGF